MHAGFGHKNSTISEALFVSRLLVCDLGRDVMRGIAAMQIAAGLLLQPAPAYISSYFVFRLEVYVPNCKVLGAGEHLELSS